MTRPLRHALAALLLLTPSLAWPTVVGHTEAPPPLDAARVATLPASQRQAWLDYLDRSRRAEARDRQGLAVERKDLKTIPPLPPLSPSARTLPLDRNAEWYASPEAIQIGDVIVSFQTPSGGWGKNTPMNGTPRARGQMYSADNNNRFPAPGDLDQARDPNWHYVGTLDNDATYTQMLFLDRMVNALPRARNSTYAAAFYRGVDYLLNAQYPNGGWPQVWPLEGGYHDAITFNDDAMLHAVEILSDVAAGTDAGDFIDSAEIRARARSAVTRAMSCILAAQVRIAGKPTLWPQQSDPLTLEPVAGRNYEPPALSTDESTHVLEYLMSLPNPTPAEREAVRDGIAWLQSHALHDLAWTGSRQDPAGRHLAAQPGASALWPRYESLTTGQPIFGDRDRTIHDDVNEISRERRNGYAWFNTEPAEAIRRYAQWKSGAAPQPAPTE